MPDLSLRAAEAFEDLCRLYDPLLLGEAGMLSPAAKSDLRAFARLFDLAEAAGEAEVWQEVRLRLQQGLTRTSPLQFSGDWEYADHRQAA